MKKVLIYVLIVAALATVGVFCVYSVPSLRTKYLLWRITNGPSASADEAFREIMKTQSPIVGKKIDGIEIADVHYQVDEVFVSTQTSSAPIVVVISELTATVVQRGKVSHSSPFRSFYLLDGRGRRVEPFLGNNSMLMEGRFCDLNADGVIDRIDSVSVQRDQGSVEILYVVPVTIEQRADLIIEFNRLPANEAWSWRVIEPRGSLPGRIVLGPEPTSGVVTPRAEYTWNRASRRYDGPTGGPRRNFQRISKVDLDVRIGAETRPGKSSNLDRSSEVDAADTTESRARSSLDDE